ncbi:unnamed protein product [Trichogramma brassicae]|uniref:C2H2-type domain-containing protein n=1 Tax=Trichogramma brassicae TaxID=86971 RepID=A0A6H5IIU2_9HYME|nr:unnamed protein product [Trichogramma brassicae]
MIFKFCHDKHRPVQFNLWNILGWTPLHCAVNRQNRMAIELLLKNGADPNAVDEDGYTPLHACCFCFLYDYVYLLKQFFEINDKLQKTVHVNAVDNKGRTPLKLAVEHLFPDAVDIFLDRGTDLSNLVFPFDTIRRQVQHQHTAQLPEGDRWPQAQERLAARPADRPADRALSAQAAARPGGRVPQAREAQPRPRAGLLRGRRRSRRARPGASARQPVRRPGGERAPARAAALAHPVETGHADREQRAGAQGQSRDSAQALARVQAAADQGPAGLRIGDGRQAQGLRQGQRQGREVSREHRPAGAATQAATVADTAAEARLRRVPGPRRGAAARSSLRVRLLSGGLHGHTESVDLRLVAGYRTSTALNVIHGETHIPYIQDRLNHLSNKFILKIISINNHSLIPDITNLGNSLNTLDKHNIKSNLPILNSYNNLIKITKDLIITHNHPVPYDYEYTKLLQKPPTDLNSGLLIQKSTVWIYVSTCLQRWGRRSALAASLRYAASAPTAPQRCKHTSTVSTPLPALDKLHKCDHDGCDKAYSSQEHLKRHVQIHAAVSTSYQYTRHLETHENNNSKSYKCLFDTCDKVFPKWSLMLKHRTEEHSARAEASNLQRVIGYPDGAPDDGLHHYLPGQMKLDEHQVIHVYVAGDDGEGHDRGQDDLPAVGSVGLLAYVYQCQVDFP